MKLRDCPFCGSTDLKFATVWKEYRFVACQSCRAAGPVVKMLDEYEDSRAEADDMAADLWNQALRR